MVASLCMVNLLWWLVEKRLDYQTIFFMDNITKTTLDGSHVDELGTSFGPWARYLVVTATDKGKSINNLSPFAINDGIKGIAGGDVTIKRQFNGDIYLTFSKTFQSD